MNEFRMTTLSKSINEGFVRVAVGAFIAQLDPTVEELNDIKIAVSEAVTNCIVHAYKAEVGKIYITVKIFDDCTVKISIRDKGCGISDVAAAMEPMFTTGGEDRSGLGFTVMETLCDKIKVKSVLGKGTTVSLKVKLKGRQ